MAFTILAISVAALMRVFGTGLHSADLSAQYSRAALLAESRLASIGIEEPLAEGEQAGEFDDIYRWRTTVVPYVGLDDEEIPDNLPVEVFEVTLEVLWDDSGQERSIVLQTLRLSPKRQ